MSENLMSENLMVELPNDCGYIEIAVWSSAGTDHAFVVQIDTSREPDNIPLRVNLNDAAIFGPEYTDE